MSNTCKVCANRYRLAGINAAIDRGLSSVAIANENVETGWPVTPETVTRHRRHYISDMPEKVAATQKDFAILVRDEAVRLFEAGELDLRDRYHVPGINAGTRAQTVLDKRADKGDDRRTALAITLLLSGGSESGFLAPKEMRVLDDGLTIDGEANEVG